MLRVPRTMCMSVCFLQSITTKSCLFRSSLFLFTWIWISKGSGIRMNVILFYSTNFKHEKVLYFHVTVICPHEDMMVHGTQTWKILFTHCQSLSRDGPFPIGFWNIHIRIPWTPNVSYYTLHAGLNDENVRYSLSEYLRESLLNQIGLV